MISAGHPQSPSTVSARHGFLHCLITLLSLPATLGPKGQRHSHSCGFTVDEAQELTHLLEIRDLPDAI